MFDQAPAAATQDHAPAVDASTTGGDSGSTSTGISPGLLSRKIAGRVQRRAARGGPAPGAGLGAEAAPGEAAPAPARAADGGETLGGDPAERKDGAGNEYTSTGQVGLGESINHEPPPAVGTEKRNANVKPLYLPAAPLHVEPARKVGAKELFDESSAAPLPAGYAPVTAIQGPYTQEEASPSLFVDGKPRSADVQQYQIGDCYFLSTLISVLDGDPGKVQAMMHASGDGGATVKFWRRHGRPDALQYEQVTVAVGGEVAVDTRYAQIHGAQQRSTMKSRDAWAQLSGPTLQLHVKNRFEIARWASLFEKAYARFAQTYGQYGGSVDGARTGGSGYDDIDGGWSHQAMFVFYGKEAEVGGAADVKQVETSYDARRPANQLLLANKRVVDQLLLLAGGGAKDKAPVLTATSMNDQLIPRLQDAIGAAQADPAWAALGDDRKQTADRILESIAVYEKRPDDRSRRNVGIACAVAARPGDNPGTVADVHAANPRQVLFGNNVSEPAAPDRERLQRFGAALAGSPRKGINVDLVGHASSVGKEDANEQLAQKRADRTAEAIRKGNQVADHNLVAVEAGSVGATADDAFRKVDITIGDSALLDQKSPAIRAMMDLVLDLRNIGTDHSTGQRNIYGNHVYSISGVRFVDGKGGALDLASAAPGPARDALLPQVDVSASSVKLRNPHHTNEPDRKGDGSATNAADGDPAGDAADGIFAMNLDEFFRNFTSVESGSFGRT